MKYLGWLLLFLLSCVWVMPAAQAGVSVGVNILPPVVVLGDPCPPPVYMPVPAIPPPPVFMPPAAFVFVPDRAPPVYPLPARMHFRPYDLHVRVQVQGAHR